MANFPVKLLQPRHAFLFGAADAASMEILLRPFLHEGALVDTSIRLDGIALPSLQLRDLAGQHFVFPLNSEDGSIDGSILLEHAHHPVDVASLTFHASRDGALTVVAKGVYVFDFEGLDDLGKVPFTLAARVSTCAL